MSNQPISYEQIEAAYKAPAEIIGKLPSSTETRRAADLLDQSFRYAKEARERAKSQEDAS